MSENGLLKRKRKQWWLETWFYQLVVNWIETDLNASLRSVGSKRGGV